MVRRAWEFQPSLLAYSLALDGHGSRSEENVGNVVVKMSKGIHVPYDGSLIILMVIY
jgi:hypothetical protein